MPPTPRVGQVVAYLPTPLQAVPVPGIVLRVDAVIPDVVDLEIFGLNHDGSALARHPCNVMKGESAPGVPSVGHWTYFIPPP